MRENLIVNKSKAFALDIINLYKFLTEEKKEYILSKQLLRSGTSIGANIREGIRGQSKADFISKMSIALKEADETMYWLELLNESSYIDDILFIDISSKCNELIKILVSITKTALANNSRIIN